MGVLAGSAALLADDPDQVVIDPAIQASREATRTKMLQTELSQADPNGDAAKALKIELAAQKPRLSLLSGSAALLDDGGRPAVVKPASAAAPETPVFPESPEIQGVKAFANQASGVGSAILGGWRGLSALVSGAGLDEAVRQTQAPELAGGLTARPYEGGTQAEKIANVPGEVIGGLANRAGEAVTDVAGPGWGTAANTAIQAAPLLLMRRRPIEALPEKVVGSGSIADGKPATALEAAPDRSVPPIPAASPSAPEFVRQAPSAQALATVAEEQAPKFAPTAESAAPGTSLPPDAQARRVQVLQSVGLDEARQSALKGDPKAAATDYQTSKLDNEGGDLLKAAFDKERQALTNYSEKIVGDTGGTLGTDSASLEARGHAILQPLDALKGWFDQNTKKLYAAADQQAGGVATEMPKTHEFIGGDQADFLGTTEGESLLKGVKARMKSLGMLDKDGNPQPATVQQAEQLKQYLNNQWQPRTGRLIRGMKDAIDDDVTSSAGGDVYQEARAMRRMRAVTLDDPNGIAKIMDASGPEGVNRAVPAEKIPDAIANMPNAQFAHVVKTLQSVPPELQGSAQAALSEIKAQFANKIRDAGIGPNSPGGSWRNRGVSDYLNKNSAKMSLVFTPEEMASIGNLNEAGHILAKETGYPGAAVQSHNLLQRGALATLPKIGAAAGATIGSLFAGAPGTGAVVGEAAGSSLAGKLGQAATLKAAQKRMVKLSEIGK